MILIIANARRKGGLSGSDNIYEALGRAEEVYYRSLMIRIDFKPFWLCYICRIIIGCWRALVDRNRCNLEFVYSASDFLMDSLPALIYKLRGCKWVAGFYLDAPKNNKVYYYSQKIARWYIRKYADVVCVTNESMFDGFKGKKLIAVHGGVDLSMAPKHPYAIKEYDAVFVGRLHYTKGIKELTQIWDLVLKEKPDARLAVIGDGDTDTDTLTNWKVGKKGVHWYGYMDDDRFDVYAKSKMVLYTTPPEHSHFSMGPVEAMACGCVMVMYDLPVMKHIGYSSGMRWATNKGAFVSCILEHSTYEIESKNAKEWAKTWDWSKRAPKVLKQIRGYLQ